MAGKVSNTIVTDGLVRYWDLANNECYPKTGTSARTLSFAKNINTNSINGNVIDNNSILDINFPSATFTEDGIGSIYGQAVAGTNGVDIFDLTYESSVCVWIKLVSPVPQGNIQLIQFGTGLPVCLNLDYQNQDYIIGAGISTNLTIFDSSPIVLDTWYNIVITQNPTQVVNSLYVNGQLADDGSEFLGFGITSEISILDYIKLSILSIYDRIITPSEVLQNYNVHKNRFGL